MSTFSKTFYLIFFIAAIVANLTDFHICFLIMSGAMFLEGFFRVANYHPKFNKGFHQWLMTTPWRGETLPGGDCLLSIRDYTILVITIIISWLTLPEKLFLYPLISFLTAYNFAMILTLDKKLYFIPAIIAPLWVYVDFNLTFLLSAIFLSTVFILRLYKNDRENLFPKRKALFSEAIEIFNPLAPDKVFPRVSNFSKILLTLTAFTWALMLCKFQEGIHIKEQAETILGLSVLAAVLKYCSYLHLRCSGFFYRIKHLKLWDFKHDRIFIWPALKVIMGFILSTAILEFRLYSFYTIPFTVATLTAMSLFLGPSYKEWQLSGKIKLETPSVMQLNQVKKNPSNLPLN